MSVLFVLTIDLRETDGPASLNLDAVITCSLLASNKLTLCVPHGSNATNSGTRLSVIKAHCFIIYVALISGSFNIFYLFELTLCE